MTSQRLRLALIIGSTREGRFGDVVANWFSGQVWSRSDFMLDVIDLAELALPPVWTRTGSALLDSYWSSLDAADVFVVVTPEYNHSYPAGLKQAIDLSNGQFTRKPVGFVSYGGMSGGLRAVEHLRTVFAEVRAATIRDTVSFHAAWDRFDESGQPHDPAVPDAARVLLDELSWWGRALRMARVGDAARSDSVA
jgi:NAD(P)H-dependent FMN reductase